MGSPPERREQVPPTFGLYLLKIAKELLVALTIFACAVGSPAFAVVAGTLYWRDGQEWALPAFVLTLIVFISTIIFFIWLDYKDKRRTDHS